MVEYKCDKCNKIFARKYDFNKHQKRKFPCKSKEPTSIQNIPENTHDIPEIYPKISEKLENNIKCVYCNKIFVYKSGLYRHIKLRCKVKKEHDEEKQKIFDRLVKEVDEIKNDNKELKDEINKIKSKTKKKITIKNSNINSNNKIQIIAFGKEDFTKLDNNEFIKILMKGYYSTVELANKMHFNPLLPEYHNIYIPNITSKYTMISNGSEWILTPSIETIDNLYDNNKCIIEDKMKELVDLIPYVFIAGLERWLRTQDNDKRILRVKDELKLLLYNKREIPMNTSNKIEN